MLFRSPFSVQEYFETEDMGILPPRLCRSCKAINCRECEFRKLNMDAAEQKVVEKQESLISLNEAGPYFETKYTWTEEVQGLRDNKGQAIAFQTAIERKLVKDKEIELYNQELKKAIDKGYLGEATEEELSKYKGPASYVSHHPVYKESKSTPIRIATNSSLKNKNSGGLSPNSCMGKPPNALSSLL